MLYKTRSVQNYVKKKKKNEQVVELFSAQQANRSSKNMLNN